MSSTQHPIPPTPSELRQQATEGTKSVFLIVALLLWVACCSSGCAREVAGRKTDQKWQPQDVTALYSAVAEGNVKTIGDLAARFGKQFLNSPLPGETKNANGKHENRALLGWRALHIAVDMKKPDSLEALLKLGADPDVRDADGLTPLAMAVKGKRKNCVDLLLKHGADCEMRDAEGQAPLHLAVINNDTGIAKVLLAAGADPNARAGGARSGYVPLHLVALVSQDKAMAEVLIWAGASVNARASGVTPLAMAETSSIAMGGKPVDKTGFLELLKKHGASR